MTYRPPVYVLAFTFAVVSGVLLATGRYVGGAILAVVAIAMVALRQFADRRGDDDRTEIW